MTLRESTMWPLVKKCLDIYEEATGDRRYRKDLEGHLDVALEYIGFDGLDRPDGNFDVCFNWTVIPLGPLHDCFRDRYGSDYTFKALAATRSWTQPDLCKGAAT